MMDDILYKIALTKIPLVGAITAKSLVSYCGSAQAVFEAGKKELIKIPGIGPAAAKHILSKNALQEAELELFFVEKHAIQPLFFLDDNYPNRLKRHYDCPIILYYKGSASLNHPRIVGVVGTRKPTVRGKLNCERLIEDLKDYDPLVISGLAFGIDIAAHRKSVEKEIETVGVLGHGLQRIYPHEHRSIAYQMVERGGLLTEFGSDQGPEREHFPMRNRIIAGLCDALVVVETNRKGGSMITAEIATNYNKDVFAFPGRVNDSRSRGCNHLIKTHKAAMIERAHDIAYVMRWEEQDRKKQIQSRLFHELSKSELAIVRVIQEREEVSIDRLAGSLSLSSSEMASLLLTLECKGVVKTLPGKRYILVS